MFLAALSQLQINILLPVYQKMTFFYVFIYVHRALALIWPEACHRKSVGDMEVEGSSPKK